MNSDIPPVLSSDYITQLYNENFILSVIYCYNKGYDLLIKSSSQFSRFFNASALPKCDFIKREELVCNTLKVGFDFFKEMKTENYNELIEKADSEINKNKIEIAKQELKQCTVNSFLDKHGDRAEIYCIRSYLICALGMDKQFYSFKSSTPTRSNNYSIQIKLGDYTKQIVKNDSALLLNNFRYYLNDKFNITKSEGKKLKRFYIIDQSIIKALIEYNEYLVKIDNHYDRDSPIRVLNFPLRDVPPGFVDDKYIKPYGRPDTTEDCIIEAKPPEREIIKLYSSSDDSSNLNETEKVNESMPEQIVEPLAVQIDETPDEPVNVDKTVNEISNSQNEIPSNVSSNPPVTASLSKKSKEKSPVSTSNNSRRMVTKTIDEHVRENRDNNRRLYNDNRIPCDLFNKYSINPDNINNFNRMNNRLIPAPLPSSFSPAFNVPNFSVTYRNDNGYHQTVRSMNYNEMDTRRVKFKNIENNFILANDKMNKIASSNFIRFINAQDKSRFDITFLNEMERGLQMINDCCDSIMDALVNQNKK